MTPLSKKLILLGTITLSILIVFLVHLYRQTPISEGDVYLDINYKKDLALDLYMPTGNLKEQNPVIIFYHGGAWIGGFRITLNAFRIIDAINELRSNGYAVISADYTLLSDGQSPFPNCIKDAYEVLNWAKTNADNYHLDVNNIGLIGESAGAHLAMMVAYAPAEQFITVDKPLPKVKYVINFYGPSNLQSLYKNDRITFLKSELKDLNPDIRKKLDISTLLLGVDPDQNPIYADSIMKTYSPIQYITESIPNTMIIHGEEDIVVPVGQSLELIERFKQDSASYEHHIIPEMDHMLRFATKQQKKDIQRWIVDFVLKNKN